MLQGETGKQRTVRTRNRHAGNS
jgi:hypothetical protein